MFVLQTKTGRASPPLPRLGFRANDDDQDMNTSVRKTSRATPLPRIGRRRLVDNVVRRAPLPRLGYRKTPDGKRSLPLPRIGRRTHDHWNLENDFPEPLPRARHGWNAAAEKRPVPLPRMG